MKAGLQEINEQVGIWGSLVINNQGDIITNQTPPGLNKASLENISNHALSTLSSAGESITDLTEAVFHFSSKKVYLLDLEKAILMVICTPSADISLLRMTTNVVVTSWGADQKVQKQLKDNHVERV